MSGELHILEVDPTVEPAKLRKLARRYAMTGGFELVLKEKLTGAELTAIASTYLPELAAYPAGSLRQKASLAARVLRFISDRPELDDETRSSVNRALS